MQAMTLTKFLCLSAIAEIVLWAPLNAQQHGPDLEVLQLHPDFYVMSYEGSNTSIQVGSDGVIVVDGGSAAGAQRVLAELRKLTPAPIRFIINTAAEPDHVGANEVLSKAGQSIIPVGGLNANLGSAEGRATILAELHVLTRMSEDGQKFPETTWPTDTFSADIQEYRKDLYVNGQAVRLFHQSAAHSDGDTIIFFRRSDVIAAGDILDTRRFPMIDVEKGGSIQGEIDSLNTLLDLAVASTPFVWKEGGTFIVPGHGRIYDRNDLVEYRDMVTIIRDTIADMIKRGMTLEQVKNADPTRGYRRQFGSDSGTWTTDKFVEAIYVSLSRKK
jgi:glyoxylase-like metal-dependent hydrolase (beta-lactamase superfamily II)